MPLWLQVIKHVPYEELKTIYRKTKKARLARRYFAILKMYEGMRLSKVAKELYITPQCVRKWVNKWNNAGLKGLISKPRSGRPPILNSKEKMPKLREEVLTSPQKQGYEFSNWTMKAVKGHIKNRYSKEISISGVCRMLKRNDISRVMPRPMLAKGDPKKKRILNL